MTSAVASCVPPVPVAVKENVVVLRGKTSCEPLAATDPMPAIETVLALVVDHVSSVPSVAVMAVGDTESVAVGAGGTFAAGEEAEELPHPGSSRASTISAQSKYFIPILNVTETLDSQK